MTETGNNRRMITISTMLATIIQALDVPLADVAPPHMQGRSSASPARAHRLPPTLTIAGAGGGVLLLPVCWKRRGRARDREGENPTAGGACGAPPPQAGGGGRGG